MSQDLVAKQADLVESGDIPAVKDPEKIASDLATDPMPQDLKQAMETLQGELAGIKERMENGVVDPEAEHKTLDKTSKEAERMMAMMAAKGMNNKLGFPVVEEIVKAVMRLLKSIMDFVLRRKSDPVSGYGDPTLQKKADETGEKVNATESVVDAKLAQINRERQAELDAKLDVDSPTPSSAPKPAAS